MNLSRDREKCLKGVREHHALLVYPLENRVEPPSLWRVLHPRSPMRWEWDQDGDDRVARLWVLREELSRSGEVVYSKWFRGRATFFSKEAFVHLLRTLRSREQEANLKGEAKGLYDLLLESSPRSTKELKIESDLRGRLLEGVYQKAMKQLFEAGLVVGWGEVDEGAFPSLATGATRVLFEDLWEKAASGEAQASLAWLEKNLPADFSRYLKRKRAVFKEAVDED
ncbi:MAG: hypothetical protein KF865_04880 [Bdellovibrionaceae bacterium]|nr:hypothetical protein [Pseudobdellovibrionaceae bacterium]